MAHMNVPGNDRGLFINHETRLRTFTTETHDNVKANFRVICFLEKCACLLRVNMNRQGYLNGR